MRMPIGLAIVVAGSVVTAVRRTRRILREAGRAMIAAALASACQAGDRRDGRVALRSRHAVQRIYFANHSSHLDFVVIWSALPPRLRRHARPVAGRDYWDAARSPAVSRRPTSFARC